jgi:hypothetical protein
MISLIEAEEDNIGNLDQIRKDLGTAAAAVATSEVQTVEETAAQKKKRVIEIDDEELPERMRGKDLKDIVEMYKNLESVNGRMANDLGSQRQLTDRLLDLKRQSDLGSQAPVKAKIDVNELLDNPNEAIEKILAERERTQQDRVAALEMQLAARDFLTKHSDYEQFTNDPQFAEWVKGTSYRASVANRAANGDYSAADELLTEYKDRTKSKPAAVTKPKEDNLETARAASLESSGAAAREAGSAKTGKIWRRADLLKLQLEDPDSYYDQSFQDVIKQAYVEKRVR